MLSTAKYWTLSSLSLSKPSNADLTIGSSCLLKLVFITIVRSALDGLERLKDDSVQYLAVDNIVVSKNEHVENYQDPIPMLQE